MDTRGVGTIPGRETSSHRALVLDHLENALRGLPFPATREALCRFMEGLSIPLGEEDQEIPASDLIKSLYVDEFSSPRHVREAVDINWRDFADVYRPGGGG